MSDLQETSQPTEETISLRWLVRLLAWALAGSMVLVFAAEAIQAYAITDMAVTLRIAENTANTLLVALVTLSGADKLVGKPRPFGGNAS